MDPKNLAGSVKVAILIKSLGEEISTGILNYFDDSERDLIMRLVSEIGDVSPNLVDSIAEEFARLMEEKSDQTTDFSLVAKNRDGSNERGKGNSFHGTLNAIRSMSADQLVQLIKDEHPQTIAIIIVHLKLVVAGEVLANLPGEIRTDVARRIAKLDKIVSGMVDEINNVFEELLKESKSSTTKETDGVNCLADLLNQIDGSSGSIILEEMEESDPELVEMIRQLMFVFDDIVYVDDRGLQNVLRSVETRDLALALKAASDEVKEKIYRNMSERAGMVLKEEIDSMGAVRMKEVSDAQLKITKIIQDKESEGELIISGRGGEEFVG